MPESTQHKLDRVRPPRVQITYDVETRGSFVKKELPFVVGIMADLSTQGGQMSPDGQTPIPLRDRKYMEIDRDNFNDIMKSLKPTVALNGGSYSFESLEDFSPIRLLQPANTELNNVHPADASALGKARGDYVRRTQLSDIVAKLDGNVALQNRFIEALKDTNRATSKAQFQGVKEEATARLPQPSTTTAATGTPATGTPATGTPATGTPATETPATGTPATGTPATETPATPKVEDKPATVKMSTPPAQLELTKLKALQSSGIKVIRDPQPTAEQTIQVMDSILELIQQVDDGKITLSGDSPDIVSAINQHIAKLDQSVNDSLNTVMQDSEFQRLERSWRGLHYLVNRAETSTMLKLRLLNATKDEIGKDLDRAVEFDQSAQFKKIYEEEYGTFGGSPYSVLIGDYVFDRSARDMGWLEKMSNVAAAAHAPFIAGVDPKLFDLDSFSELGNPRDLAKIFESSELAKWRSFRDSEDSRYVALCLPRFLLRQPYGRDDYTTPDVDPTTSQVKKDKTGKAMIKAERLTGRIPADDVDFQEKVDGNPDDYCWGNPAYALAERITNAFALYKWTAAIRGVEGGGLVEGIPAVTFKTDEGDKVLKYPTETAITDRREKELNDLGFITLVHCKNTDKAAFFGGQTTQKPKVYQDPQATANAKLSSQLPYIMATSRFAHYIKAMMRDKVGSFMTKENVSDYLNKWIADYVLLDDRASQSSKASYPLREARVDVEDVVGKPGVYKAVVYLRPHFQLDELTASLRLVAELPPPVAG